MKWVMLSARDEAASVAGRTNNQSSSAWLYFSLELLLSVGISIVVALLRFMKTLLPAPPRSLKGDVVLVAGVNSSLGSSLAEEFAKEGCCVICVDANLKSAESVVARLRSKYPAVQSLGPDYLKQDRPSTRGSMTRAYECDLYDRADIQMFARKVKDEVGRVDVLVTCTGEAHYDIFDTVSKTLMSHYWTIMSFLPILLMSERANIIGVIPNVSTKDAYAGSKAAIVGLIESLSDIFSSKRGQLNFIAISPKTNIRDRKKSDQKIARDIVEAVQMGQNNLNFNCISRLAYKISRAIYEGLNFITQYIDT